MARTGRFGRTPSAVGTRNVGAAAPGTPKKSKATKATGPKKGKAVGPKVGPKKVNKVARKVRARHPGMKPKQSRRRARRIINKRRRK